MATAKLIRSRAYRDSLVREYEFHAGRNPRSADALVERIERAAALLKDFPLSGRAWRTAGTRELIIPGLPYVVVYRVRGDMVELLTLFHTSREVSDVH